MRGYLNGPAGIEGFGGDMRGYLNSPASIPHDKMMKGEL